MTIDIHLSTESILSAIHRLNQAKEHIRWGLQDTIDILVSEGADIAQAADGSMATVIGYLQDEHLGVIDAVGENPIIAEFGAGDATLSPSGLFENVPDTPVYPGAYSELVGTGQYADYGWWKFGGKIYTQVEPRQGMYKAKEYIKSNGARIASEVIKL